MEKTKGHLHPITQFTREVVGIFAEMGFIVADGPELEKEFYNFDALNIPADHPSRDMQDTFWIKTNNKDKIDPKNRPVMRTQTSAVQVRFLEKYKDSLPCAIVVPGKVFRNEATDATHEAQFSQLEALYVDKDVSLGHLKGVIEHFLKKLYGDDVEIRFRPSFFPFVEPGVEVDMKFNGKWLEMGGAGMVHPNVLRNGGLNPDECSGFAFGWGVERILMMKSGLPDLRLIYSDDIRFLKQF